METSANPRLKKEKYASSVWEELLGYRLDSSEGQPGDELQEVSREQKTDTISVADLPISLVHQQESLSFSPAVESVWPELEHPLSCEQQQWPAREKDEIREKEALVAPVIHTEIAGLAMHLGQWKERLLSPPQAPSSVYQQDTSENDVEENDAFPGWLL